MNSLAEVPISKPTLRRQRVAQRPSATPTRPVIVLTHKTINLAAALLTAAIAGGLWIWMR